MKVALGWLLFVSTALLMGVGCNELLYGGDCAHCDEVQP